MQSRSPMLAGWGGKRGANRLGTGGGRGGACSTVNREASGLQLSKENLWVGSDGAPGLLLFPLSFSFLLGLPPSTPATDVTRAPAEHVLLDTGSHVNRSPFPGGSRHPESSWNLEALGNNRC